MTTLLVFTTTLCDLAMRAALMHHNVAGILVFGVGLAISLASCVALAVHREA